MPPSRSREAGNPCARREPAASAAPPAQKLRGVLTSPDMGSEPRRQVEPAREARLRLLANTVAKRERELAILSEVAARVHGAQDVAAIFHIALEEICRRMGLETAWVFMGEEGGRLELAAHRGLAPSYLETVRSRGLGECLCSEVFRTGHRMQARNTGHCPRLPQLVEGTSAVAGHACVPLLFERGTAGVLNVASRPGEPFSDDELRFLETLGHQIALAVERARHRQAEHVRDQEARAMAAISKAVGGSLDPAAVIRAVGRTAGELLGGDQVHIFLGSDPRRLRLASLTGPPEGALAEGQAVDLVADGWRLTARAVELRRLVRMDGSEAGGLEGAREGSLGAAAVLVTPLLAHDQPLGALVVSRRRPHAWTPGEVETAEALATQAAVALENARLFDEARTAYLELKDAQERIIRSEKMAVLGTFASGLAHEVRNPLNSMALQLSILERRIGRCEPGLSLEMAELTGIIREEIKRLDTLVNDFLLFSRTDRLQQAAASLEALVDEIVRLMRPEAKAGGVTLRRQRVGEPVPPLRMDAEKMKQVVMNLVRNAIEAMPDGGTVTVECGLVGGRARLVVRDTGPGLPPGLDVFQLFVTTKPRGTGLGLSIVQQIVLQHGGDIDTAAEPGQGACFAITLPVVPAEAGEEVRA